MDNPAPIDAEDTLTVLEDEITRYAIALRVIRENPVWAELEAPLLRDLERAQVEIVQVLLLGDEELRPRIGALSRRIDTMLANRLPK